MTVLNVRAGTDKSGVTRQIYFWSGNDPAPLSLHVSRPTLFSELKKIYIDAGLSQPVKNIGIKNLINTTLK